MDTSVEEARQPDSPRLTRRRLLGTTARLAAAAFASLLLPPNLRRAVAEPAVLTSWTNIEHVVLLMQENRSFDHYFGTLAGVRGFEDADALQLAGGASVFHQPDSQNPDGHLLPFHLDTRATSAQRIPSTSHAWRVQHEAWNQGQMDRWLPAHRAADGVNGPYVMGYYDRTDLPFHYALADAFTICDAYHCSLFGPTWPNRLYWMTGSIDPAGAGGGPVVSNHYPQEGWTWTTYAERLQQAGVTWKVYQEADNYGLNVLEYFKTFRNADHRSPLYQFGMVRGRRGAFEHDARHGQLPAVSWILPTSRECEHPDYLPAAGAAFIASKLEALASNPDQWAKTVFIVCYDENDGLFDHVSPPVPAAGTEQEFVAGLPIGAGYRVPCLIVSPWTVGGWVCSQPFDHTSVLQFLEKFTGVPEPNISAWRRQTFGDLTAAFRFGETDLQVPDLPDTDEQLRLAENAVAHLPAPSLPGAGQTMPVQEPGDRKRLTHYR